jgi:threonyl-tRNA synthetase
MADNNKDQLHTMRHSLAHIMATAVQELWPEAKFGVGPVVENGFYYDIDLGDHKVTEDDFVRIEKAMQAVIKADHTFEQFDKGIDEAIEWAKGAKQPYKEELLNDLKRAGTTVAKDLDVSELGLATDADSKVENVSFYKDGPFTDLCRGPHVESTGRVGAFKLMRVAGAYWRGKEGNPQMQRLYGVAFTTDKELTEYLAFLEEAKKRDHRKLGQELDLFVFSDLVGQGLPLWTPRGTKMREILNVYGYEPVTIPHITKKELYEKSGHWSKFASDLFRITTREGHEFAMKPMNCPHHIQIFDRAPHSYREMPIRYSETTMVYRDEQSGELGGLSRVRSITQDDAHVFCRGSQIKDEILSIWDIIERFYGAFDLKLKLRLSLYDPEAKDNYLGESKTWEDVESQLKTIAHDKLGDDYEIGIGEAAFYGPKLDFMATDAIGREHQVATIQLDFNNPERFDLFCINEKGEQERIFMIHAAIMGSIERFMAMMIEHTAGRFPVWLAPEQVRVATVNDSEAIVKKATEIVALAREHGLRAKLDDSSESVGKKIRASEVEKVPYTIVVGLKEVESGEVTPRIRGDLTVAESRPMQIANFVESVANEVKSRTSRSSL